VADVSIPGRKVVEVLDRLANQGTKSKVITVDYGWGTPLPSGLR
jgi:hypothetical protein